MEALQEYQRTNLQQVSGKRKYAELSSDDTSNCSSNLTTTIIDNELEQAAERRQPKELFRPWLLKDNNERKRLKLTHSEPHIVQYHPNKVRSFQAKERTPKDQKRRDRNTLTCLLSRRAKKIEERIQEQQYLEYRIQLEAVDLDILRASLYLKELQRLVAVNYAASTFVHTQPLMHEQFTTTQEAPPTLFVFQGQ